MTTTKISLNPQMYFIDDVEKITRRNRLTLRRRWNKNLFPKPTLVMNRCCWKAEIIHKWIQENVTNAEV